MGVPYREPRLWSSSDPPLVDGLPYELLLLPSRSLACNPQILTRTRPNHASHPTGERAPTAAHTSSSAMLTCCFGRIAAMSGVGEVVPVSLSGGAALVHIDTVAAAAREFGGSAPAELGLS